MVRRGAAGLVALLFTLLLPRGVETAAPLRPTEYDVKAAFLFHFAKFVKWPDEEALGPTFVVAVLGDDPFGDVLDRTFTGKTVLNRTVEVRRLASVDPAAAIQILFVSSSEKPRLPQVLKNLEGASVLTVGEMDGFADRGGMIAFRMKEDSVHFDINLDRVERANLKMSSQLIRLALRVISGKDGV